RTPRSIRTWEDLVSKFINQFFPPSKTTNLRNEITNFQQKFEELFSEAWDRFKDLLRACLHHGFTKLHQLDTFYNALNPTDQDSLNAAARVSANTSSTMACPSKMATLTDAVNAMLPHVKTSPSKTINEKMFEFKIKKPEESLSNWKPWHKDWDATTSNHLEEDDAIKDDGKYRYNRKEFLEDDESSDDSILIVDPGWDDYSLQALKSNRPVLLCPEARRARM
ncbi:reverse transcriptase domain-containing protein, partial [Tanacetum coccineum]